MVHGVTEDKAGIGYSGIGYKTSGVKALALADKDGETAYEPTYDNVLERQVPARPLPLRLRRQGAEQAAAAAASRSS